MKALRILSIAASLSLGFASSLLAQDVLITQEGDAHKVYEIEIGASSIFYKLENTPEASIQKIDKSQVLMIKYQDGRKVIMGEEEKEKEQVAQNEQQQSQDQPITFTPEEEAEIAALNAKLIEKHNQRKVEWTDSKKKKASRLFCTFGLKKGSRLQDKNVKITFMVGYKVDWYNRNKQLEFISGTSFVNPGIQMSVENISTKTVYVDLGNSFFIRNGKASPYYTPSATSTTTGSSGGASINLGSVASALGVGGIAGTLASGVNVGGGKSSSSSTVTYAQRVVAIPPKSEIRLEFQPYFLSNSSYWKFQTDRYTKNEEKIVTKSKGFDIDRGETIIYTEKDNTLTYGVRVAYSFKESCQHISTLHADIFLKEILGGADRSGCYGWIDSNRLTPNWKDVIYMIVQN